MIQSHSDQVNINATISQEQPDAREQHLQLETEEIHEELRYTVIENEGNMAAVRATSFLAIVAMLCLLLIH